MSEFGDNIGELPCKHKFDMQCIVKWAKEMNLCPLCKK